MSRDLSPLLKPASIAIVGASSRPESLQGRMVEMADANGMILCGPNSIGILNFVDFIPLSFTSSEDMDQRKTGRVAIVSQSGGLMGSLSNRSYEAGVGTSYGVATGNEA